MPFAAVCHVKGSSVCKHRLRQAKTCVPSRYTPIARYPQTHKNACDEIGCGTCSGGQRHTPASVFEVGNIDRHRPRPAKSKHQQAQKPDRVNMRHRRQRHRGPNRAPCDRPAGTPHRRAPPRALARHKTTAGSDNANVMNADCKSPLSKALQSKSSTTLLLAAQARRSCKPALRVYPFWPVFNVPQLCICLKLYHAYRKLSPLSLFVLP